MAKHAQKRHPAGSSMGGKFAPKFATPACPGVYAMLDTIAPSDVHHALEWEGKIPASFVAVSGVSNEVRLHVERCPHGSFMTYARNNCCWEGDE